MVDGEWEHLRGALGAQERSVLRDRDDARWQSQAAVPLPSTQLRVTLTNPREEPSSQVTRYLGSTGSFSIRNGGEEGGMGK